ncbi:hypothetical protein [Streptomyces sp. ISL-100]|uniref:hypothetical protein n=1 Tax=Streptomyces sp. ISL-100 TaxID=2819173 RepID=UPI001BE93765|nr:hypothetical protein [Streptomyces sp. ISL-100]MBT2396245.1 hypothetical protein [Streptomyces sp. ISL-100]
MTALVYESAAPLPVAAFANDVETASRVDLGLRRFLASDAVTVGLYDDLETVLGEDATRLSPEDSAVISDRLRDVVPALKDVVERLLKPYPPQMDAVMDRSSEFPGPEDVYGHLVRFASSILTVLDLMGEIAELREDDPS